MLGITVPGSELWDEAAEKFVVTPKTELVLEHSLVSISKWESLTEKPFLGSDQKTQAETLEYVKCMTISPVSSPEVYVSLSPENLTAISSYIDRKMTATVFSEAAGNSNTGEFVTAEIIYYWMIALNVPLECQHWHLNRLLALVKVLNLKNAPAKKMGRREAMAQQRSLNAERKARFNTTG